MSRMLLMTVFSLFLFSGSAGFATIIDVKPHYPVICSDFDGTVDKILAPRIIETDSGRIVVGFYTVQGICRKGMFSPNLLKQNFHINLWEEGKISWPFNDLVENVNYTTFGENLIFVELSFSPERLFKSNPERADLVFTLYHYNGNEKPEHGPENIWSLVLLRENMELDFSITKAN